MPLKSMVAGLSKPLDHNEPFEFESDNETAEVEIYLQLSMQEKLARAIEKEMNSIIFLRIRVPFLSQIFMKNFFYIAHMAHNFIL
jgi:hypothetical protein